MTYSLNGIPFDNVGRGWSLRSTSKPMATLSNELSAVSRQGRHGVLSPDLGVISAPSIVLVVRVPRAGRQTLEAFVRKGGVLTSAYEAGETEVEFASLSPSGYGDGDETVELTIAFRIPAGAARGPVVTTPVLALNAASVPVAGLFPNLGIDVQDALVRVKGAATGLQVTDSGGSWFTFADAIPADNWLRFEAGSGRGFLTTTDVWAGGTEVSGRIDFGGPRGLFEISPSWGADPSVRAGALTVATGSRTGAQIQVRGRAAYLV